MNCKAQIVSVFNIHGYTLRSEALKYLQEKLESLERTERNEELKKIIEIINTQNLTSTFIARENVEAAFSNLDVGSPEDDILFRVFDSFSLNRFTYNSDSKKFLNWSTFHSKISSLHGSPDSKSDIYIEKYKMVHQRTARHRLFAAPAIAHHVNSNTFSLKAVEHLLGSTPKENNVIILGMLTQLKEGQFYLEDPTGTVRLNLNKAVYKEGLFTENNIVLAEGYYEDRVFYVTAIGFPPPEPAEVTLSQFPNFSVTPYPSMNSHRLSNKLKLAEEANGEAMFVFLSDVWLDQLKVMQKLQILFAGYSLMPPTCFVLIGNFLSIPIVGAQSKIFEDCFSQLGSLINEFPGLVKGSHFVFVPGPDDPGLPHILPRPGIPTSFLGDFKKKVPTAIFTSNPCRIQYCSQEIVVFREDIISKMCRNSIYTPWEHEEKVDIPNLAILYFDPQVSRNENQRKLQIKRLLISEENRWIDGATANKPDREFKKFVKTVIANGHLMPLPLNVAPIYWEYDHAFWLYPLPDVVVCADKYDPYTVTSSNSIFFNPGSLPRSNFSFKVYFPASKQVEDSEISDEALN